MKASAGVLLGLLLVVLAAVGRGDAASDLSHVFEEQSNVHESGHQQQQVLSALEEPAAHGHLQAHNQGSLQSSIASPAESPTLTFRRSLILAANIPQQNTAQASLPDQTWQPLSQLAAAVADVFAGSPATDPHMTTARGLQQYTSQEPSNLQEPHFKQSAAALYDAIQQANSRVSGRSLLQASTAPTLCGKIGTYTPNIDSAIDGSMFGFGISSSSDGSVLAVGAPIHTSNPKTPGAAFALVSRSSRTCEYVQYPVLQPAGTYRYFGAQVALSEDGRTMVVMDGVEGMKTGTEQGNRPVVHVYKKQSDGSYGYFQKLNGVLRRAMASTMSVSANANGGLILVSFSVAEGYTDKRGSAQIFVQNGTSATTKYTYLQDLALLNMPAGVSTQFGSASAMSSNGMTIAVSTAAALDSYVKYTYMYRKDNYTGQFRIVSAINHGEFYGDTWTAGRGVGLTDDNAVAITQTGRFILRVENAMLVVYEWSGTGMSIVWKRRCQLAAPEGYTFRTTGAALSIVEVSSTRVKFAAGAYTGQLDKSPSSVVVFLYYLNLQVAGSCPYRAAEKHVHNDPYSNYGAAVTITPNGNLLLVGAPSAWDNNMQKQYGAVYALDISTVADDGVVAMTVTPAANTYAGCVNGKDANGNACVTKQAGTELCKTVTKSDGSVVHYGPTGCTPTPAAPSFWTSSNDGTYATSAVSAYTTVAASTKGGVSVPVGTTSWLSNVVTNAVQAAYYGYAQPTASSSKTSVTPASGWQSSVSPVGGGLGATTSTASTGISTPSTISILSTMLSSIGNIFRNLLAGLNSGSTGSTQYGSSTGTTGLGLPSGAVITNLNVLNGNAGAGG